MATRRRSIRVGVRLRPAAGAAAWRVDGAAVVERPRADALARGRLRRQHFVWRL